MMGSLDALRLLGMTESQGIPRRAALARDDKKFHLSVYLLDICWTGRCRLSSEDKNQMQGEK